MKNFFFQAPDETPIATFFLIFLLWFVVIGLTPFFQDIWERILKYLRAFKASRVSEAAGPGGGVKTPYPVQTPASELYDFEVMVVGELARAGRKGLSIKHIARDLYLDPGVVKKALQSLVSRDFVKLRQTLVAGKRFYLSGKGRDYAGRQGFLPGSGQRR